MIHISLMLTHVICVFQFKASGPVSTTAKNHPKYMFGFHPKKDKEGIKPFTMPFQKAGNFFLFHFHPSHF